MAQDNKKSDWDALQDVLDKESQKTLDDLGQNDERQDKGKDVKRGKKTVKEKAGKASDDRKAAQTRKKARITKDAAAIIGRSLGFVDPNEKVARALASESVIKDSLDDGKMTAVVAMAKKTKRTTPPMQKTETITVEATQDPVMERAEESAVKPTKKKKRVKAANPEEEKETDKAFSALLAQIENVAGETSGGNKRRAKSAKREKTAKREPAADDKCAEELETTAVVQAPEIVVEPPIVVEAVVENEFASTVESEPVEAPVRESELAVATEAELDPGVVMDAEANDQDAQANWDWKDGEQESQDDDNSVDWSTQPRVSSQNGSDFILFMNDSNANDSKWELPEEDEPSPFERANSESDNDEECEQKENAFEAFIDVLIDDEHDDAACDHEMNEQEESFDFGEFSGDFWNVDDSLDVQWGRSPEKDAKAEAQSDETDEDDEEQFDNIVVEDDDDDELTANDAKETTATHETFVPFIDLDKNPEAFFAVDATEEEDLCFTPRESKREHGKAQTREEVKRQLDACEEKIREEEAEAESTQENVKERTARNERKRQRDERARETCELECKSALEECEDERTARRRVETRDEREEVAREARDHKKTRRERETSKERPETIENEPGKRERRARELEDREETRERKAKRREEERREAEREDGAEALEKREREKAEEVAERASAGKKRRETNERVQEVANAEARREERALPTWDDALSYVVNFNLARRNQRGRGK